MKGVRYRCLRCEKVFTGFNTIMIHHKKCFIEHIDDEDEKVTE